MLLTIICSVFRYRDIPRIAHIPALKRILGRVILVLYITAVNILLALPILRNPLIAARQ